MSLSQKKYRCIGKLHLFQMLKKLRTYDDIKLTNQKDLNKLDAIILQSAMMNIETVSILIYLKTLFLQKILFLVISNQYIKSKPRNIFRFEVFK